MKTLVAIAGLFLCAASTAAAQDRAAPFFIDGAAVAVADMRAYSNEQTFNPSGTVPGGSIAVGTFIVPRVSIRVEAVVQKQLRSSVTRTSGSLSFLQTTSTLAQEDDVLTTAILVGYHTDGSRRVQVGYLGGLAFLRVRSRQSVTTNVTGTLPPGIVIPPQSDSMTIVGYTPTAIAGVDVALKVSRHVSVVPQMRALAYSGALSVRPAVAVRWIP